MKHTAHNAKANSFILSPLFGAGDRYRTCCLDVGNVTLYHLSYTRIVWDEGDYYPVWGTKGNTHLAVIFFGTGNETRTRYVYLEGRHVTIYTIPALNLFGGE